MARPPLLTLIYGGSGSGKSALAETMLAGCDPAAERIYIATMSPEGDEAKQRIARHRAARAGKGFTTVETRTSLERLTVKEGASVLLECLGNLAANEMFSPDGAEDETAYAIVKGLARLLQQAGRVVVVTNDVFSDGRRYDAATEQYRDCLAALNRIIASVADQVVEMVAGVPVYFKGGPDGTDISL